MFHIELRQEADEDKISFVDKKIGTITGIGNRVVLIGSGGAGKSGGGKIFIF